MDPKWCQNVTQDGSFHGTKDRVCGSPVQWGMFGRTIGWSVGRPEGLLVLVFWDHYKDYTYVGTLDGSHQHTLIATGTRLRPLQATFLGHILGTKPAKDMGV